MPNPAYNSFAKPQLSVLRAMVVRLGDWGDGNMATPFWRLYMMESSGCSLFQGGEEWALLPSEMCLIAPETPFSGAAPEHPRQFFIHFTLGLPMDGIGPWLHRWKASDSSRAIIKSAFGNRDANRPVHSLEIMELILEGLRQIPANRWEDPVDDPRISEAVRLMEQHLRHPLSNEELAARLNMSLRSFQRLFQQHVHLSPGQYNLRLRLNHTAMLLHETRWSLEKIAEECGFCDRFALTKLFTRHRGVSPAKYRRHHAAHRPW